MMPSHGTRSNYVIGCRCDECTDANRLEQRRLNADRRARREAGEMPETIQHGTSCYCNWGCRCEICSAAWSVKMREARDRRKVRKLIAA